MVDFDALLDRAREHRRESHQGVIAAFDTYEHESIKEHHKRAQRIDIYPEPESGTCQFADRDNPRAWIEVDEYTPVGVIR